MWDQITSSPKSVPQHRPLTKPPGRLGNLAPPSATHGAAGAARRRSAVDRRTVPLPPWLAERLADYVAERPRTDEPSAPL
jgi:hypothetical protein